MSILAGRGVRAAVAAALLLACGTAALSPLVPWWLTVCAGGVLGLTLWRPEWGFLAALALAPWGARLAGVPVRATEYICAAFLAGWLLRVDRGFQLPGREAGRALLAGAIYALVAVLSWVRLAASASTATGWGRALDAVRLLPADYLVTAGRDPHTAAALQILLGVAVTCAAATFIARDRRMAVRTLLVVGCVGLAAAAATVVAVPVRYWMTGDTNELIRYFVVTRSRYSFHVSDVNAAGSHFILAALSALGLVRMRALARQQSSSARPAVAIVVLTLAALWICGSRAAMVAGVVCGIAYVEGWRLVRLGWRWPSLSPRAVGTLAALVLLFLVVSPTVIGSASAMSGSASRSMSVREEFLVTSARMLSTAPVLGVGVGTYYQRSSQFMPPGIRALYGRENAHDYFMQTMAEMGVVGFAAFVWWLGSALAPLWRRLAADGRPSLLLALLLGCTAFLLTCVTGHPLLVVEVSVPFWAAIGVALAS